MNPETMINNDDNSFVFFWKQQNEANYSQTLKITAAIIIITSVYRVLGKEAKRKEKETLKMAQ
jgi:hypothetical protein